MQFFCFSISEARHSNVLPSRSLRPSRSNLTLKSIQAATTAAASTTPPPPVLPATSLPSFKRKPTQMSPANRSKSPSKLVRPTDQSPKRTITNESINTERLKIARDEAERAMKV